jgi:tripartite-type tricarboxylate transporter receptor subunit TctC
MSLQSGGLRSTFFNQVTGTGMNSILLSWRPWRFFRFAVLLAMAAATPLLAFAQAWPSGPVRIIVPYVPGGTIDITARLMATRLSQAWGQPVVVESRSGAAGTIGANIVAKAPPDGHTLLLAAASELTIAQTIIKNMPFDALTDFTPIVLVARSPFVLVVNSKVPATNVQELIALAKRQPGKLNYGTSGAGTTTHLVAELFNSAAGVQISHIPYKGSRLMMNDLIGGQLRRGLDPVGLPAAQFAELIRADHAKPLLAIGSFALPQSVSPAGGP